MQIEFIDLLNGALRLEHFAYIQYLSHAEQIGGLYSGPVIALLKDSAADEARHAEVLRGLIGDYFYGVPALDITPAKEGGSTAEIILTNIDSEAEAIAEYKMIHAKILENKDGLSNIFEKLEHAIRHILIEEQEHVAELNRLMR